MQNDLTPILAVVAFFVLMLVGLAVWRWRSGRFEAEERERQQVLIDKGIRDGLLTPDGHRACVICGVAATAYMPISADSWMDKLPLLNRLFSLPPRYVIVDDTTEDVCLCRLHKQFATKKLEEFHAMLRAERASFNARQADKVAQMDGGALMRLVREQHKDAVRSIQSSDAKTPIPQLAEVNRDQSVVTLVSTSGPPSARDEEDEALSGS